MARRSTNTVEYFPHVAKSGKTLAILEGRYQTVGYAFWFKLLEALCTHENHFIDCNDAGTWEYLLARTPVDDAMGHEMLDLLARLGNIDCELWHGGRIIWCQDLVDNLEVAYQRRRRPSPTKPLLPVEMSVIDGVSTNQTGVSTTGSTQSIEENSIGEKKKIAADAASVISLAFYKRIQDGFLAHNGGRFTDYGKEGKAIHGLIAKARARDSEQAEDLLIAVCAQFWKLKQGNDKYWNGHPFLPSRLNSSSIWDGVLETMRRDELSSEVQAIIAGRIT